MRYNMINARKKLGLTQQDVAKLVGRKRNTISLYETGSLTPPLNIAIKLKAILQTDDDSVFLINNDI